MSDPVGDIFGDYRAFVAQQNDRLLNRDIDISPFELGHLAFRVPEWDQYVHVRTLLPAILGERHPFRWFDNVEASGPGYLQRLSGMVVEE